VNLVNQLKSASAREVELLVFGTAGLLSPGLLSVWYFAPEFYAAATTPKLLLTALALAAPFIALNSCFFFFRPIGSAMRVLMSDEDGFVFAVTFAASLNALLGSISVLIAYFTPLSLHAFFYVVMIGEIIIILAFTTVGRRKSIH
jgi:hypothetical protein